MCNSEDNSFFVEDDVVMSCSNPIYEIFKTLLLERNLKQQDLANGVNIDKANISRIVHGLYIPNLDLRLKISKFFGVDSTVIWRPKDLEYIREILNKQKRKNENN